jgi:DNA ligase 1
MMEYLKLAKVYDKLEATPARLEKTDIITGFLNETPDDLLKIIPALLMGRVFPLWSPSELGIGPGLLYDTICFVTGIGKQDLKTTIGEMGDVGNAAEKLFEKKVQTTLFSEKLTVEKVYDCFENIADASGKGAQGKKTKLLSKLLTNAAPIEAKYLVRTVLGELRVGVAEGVIRDAIANAYDIPQNVVERAYMLTNDFGKVAMTARVRGEDGLKELTMEIGTPIKPMLAQISPSIKDAIKDCGTAAFEIKYDGARIQIHKNDGVKIFSRRLEDVTSALPDVVEMVDNAVKSNVIIEGEAVAVDPETRRPRAFQDILRRFRRKYDVSKMVEKIPFEIYLFDILYADGKSTIDETFESRRKKLEAVVEPIEKKIELAEQIVTDSVQAGEKFYSKALEKGHEGVMVKNLKAPYIPGARVGYMYKIKPVMETLDLVITGALWGTGKRAGWLSSYFLGAKDVETGKLMPVGRVGSGVTEEQLEEFTNTLKPLVEFNSGGRVKLKPELVVEVAFQEIQKSPKYESGFALRFPRVMKVREDKGPDDIDTVNRIEELYNSQYR